MTGMKEQPWYKEWFSSPFYHKLYFERDEQEAAAFINRLIHHIRPAPGSQILDVACGRGRHSRILASQGFSVTGIDISRDSIEYAKQFEQENLSFYLHDMRLPFWGNYFDYAFSFFTSFGYFRTRREHDDALRTIARGLKPGGEFVIDYLNVHYAERHLVRSETKMIDGTCYEIRRWDDETHFFKNIIITDSSLREPLSFTEQVAKFTPGDFTEMLAFQELRPVELFGDYSLTSYDIIKSPRLIIRCVRESLSATGSEKRLYSDGRSTDALT
ncbi:MAG TPA: class I SAM-dependent methyltransferase [Chitinophagaceae bacterium]|nr:class I SAM-dependent methyltransferase [Chitinophagaceae bacterium]